MAETASGVLKRMRNGSGVLRDPARSFRPGPADAVVPPKLMRGLAEGATVVGPVRRGRRGPELLEVESVCGLSVHEFERRTPYNRLTAVDPHERFHLGDTGDVSMRLVDLVAPIGKGTRGLIVSPPKAGKTTLLEQIARSVHADDPQARIIVLLIDERPEEVTHFRRAVEAEVLASSIDQGVREHVELAELALAHIRTEFETGRDVVVLVDSLTRMGRTFNLRGSGRGRTMSGGIEAGALDVPRRFFGLARNAENGGSVTIIATALVDTGSRADQLIFEEFKGTGNSEIVLERSLAEARIFPAINLPASGTRKEERLYGAEEVARITQLRRVLVDRDPRAAMESLLELMNKHSTNEELLESIPRPA
ncbi:MAG: transcription termination factor Rho [Candidatus Krumholzibacteriia bacterium]